MFDAGNKFSNARMMAHALDPAKGFFHQPNNTPSASVFHSLILTHYSSKVLLFLWTV